MEGEDVKRGFAEEMLLSMGWTPGTGLGLKKDGVTEALKVKKRPERLGLGAVQDSSWTDDWWQKAFSDAIKRGREEKRSEMESSSESSNDDDAEEKLLEACEGRRCRPAGNGKMERVQKQEKAHLVKQHTDAKKVCAPKKRKTQSKRKRKGRTRKLTDDDIPAQPKRMKQVEATKA